ncbi:hypothetical protein MMC17_005229 [Xylographa soralifera]|nr:hypothetical protein [Xylographa soralifera]
MPCTVSRWVGGATYLRMIHWQGWTVLVDGVEGAQRGQSAAVVEDVKENLFDQELVRDGQPSREMLTTAALGRWIMILASRPGTSAEIIVELLEYDGLTNQALHISAGLFPQVATKLISLNLQGIF